ncbi:glycerate kinase type-2 family protein [Chondromyces crocatus]|uniref:Hydroxypyruvate reductase n=1 Tax=Chondromyces crocatus TaxID=52 RepID=A0A0K1EH42_CHOCO|nr:glycerate kinase [Chondromyces crocatus]AKT40181.1 uncharacterized protein CMC5_043340 [Chondromyces crocatus]
MSERPAWVESLREAFDEAVATLEAGGLVEQALGEVERPPERVVLVAVGKAAVGMARGAVRCWGDRIRGGLVITTGVPEERDGGVGVPRGATGGLAAMAPRVSGLEVRTAAHPVPDDRSVAAAEEALGLVRGMRPGEELLALVSGGASSLLSAPPVGVSLQEKQALVGAMLDAGAPIQEINVVRRHLSRVKGGRLAAAAAPCGTRTLLMSDVIAGVPHDIGSGPSVLDPTSIDEARAALRRWAPRHAQLTAFLSESPKPAELGEMSRCQVLANPETLAERVAEMLRRRGWRAKTSSAEVGDAEAVAARRIERARELTPGEALVIACEPTVKLPERRGAGGRAGWIALRVMRALPADVALLCAASDGVDGSSGGAGALVRSADAAGIADESITAALRSFDDGPVHRALGTRLAGGATGHNLTDVHVLARALTRG